MIFQLFVAAFVALTLLVRRAVDMQCGLFTRAAHSKVSELPPAIF